MIGRRIRAALEGSPPAAAADFHHRLLGLAGLLALLLPQVAAGAAAREPVRLPTLESGRCTVEVEGGSFPLSYSVSTAGPLVALQPLVVRLGGELKLGPLGQSHELRINQSVFVFGPDTPVVTSGEELLSLSQAPVPSIDGLMVPLDLLEMLYTENLGYGFSWDRARKVLAVGRLPQREVPVEIDLVHLQGVTTVVLRFPFKPRYRIERAPGRIDVELVGDRFLVDSARDLPRDRMVRDVLLTPQRARFELATGADAQDYVLRDPFRLVLDVFRSARADAEPAPRAARPPPRRARGQTIVLDPGHGGSETGAIGPSGLAEKEVTLQLARALRNELQRRMPVKVVLTRDEDLDLHPDARAAFANQQKADLFVSLHINSVMDPGAHGAETYFSSLEASDERAAAAAAAENASGTGDPLEDLQLILWDLAQSHHLAESQRLASLIQDELNQELGLRNRGVKQAPFRVLLGAAMPAVLVEFGFLSNPQEEQRLLDPLYRGQLVEAVTRAILRFRAVGGGTAVASEEALP